MFSPLSLIHRLLLSLIVLLQNFPILPVFRCLNILVQVRGYNRGRSLLSTMSHCWQQCLLSPQAGSGELTPRSSPPHLHARHSWWLTTFRTWSRLNGCQLIFALACSLSKQKCPHTFHPAMWEIQQWHEQCGMLAAFTGPNGSYFQTW